MFALFAAVASARQHSHRSRRAAPNASGSAIYNTAISKCGCAYRYGAAGPNEFDCSGLAMWAHKQNGISIPRTAAAQFSSGKSASGAMGDLVFFNYGKGIAHVGICNGAGGMVHAPHTGDVVKIVSFGSYWPKYRAGYKRYY